MNFFFASISFHCKFVFNCKCQLQFLIFVPFIFQFCSYSDRVTILYYRYHWQKDIYSTYIKGIYSTCIKDIYSTCIKGIYSTCIKGWVILGDWKPELWSNCPQKKLVLKSGICAVIFVPSHPEISKTPLITSVVFSSIVQLEEEASWNVHANIFAK